MFGRAAISRVVENRDARLHFAQLLTQLNAGAIGRTHVENVEVERDLLREVERLCHAAGGEHTIAAIAEERSHHQARILVIVDVKDSGFGRHTYRKFAGLYQGGRSCATTSRADPVN